MPLSSNIEKLQARLASGEITLDQYREIIVALQEPDGSPSKTQTTTCSQPSPTSVIAGRILLSAAGISLHENRLVFEEQVYRLDQITSVRGGERSQSFNLVPFERHTSLHIEFLDGKTISLKENRAWFAGRQHTEILTLLDELHARTFKSRLANLAQRLRQHQELKLYDPFMDEEPVVLDIDGIVRTPTRRVDLKVAKEHGTFGLGTERHSINMLNSRINTAEVVLSETKGLLGSLIPRGALRFTPTLEDVDIVHALLTWLSKPGNDLFAADRS